MSSGNTKGNEVAADLVNFKILANQSPLGSEYQVLSIEVSQCLNKIATAKITIADGDAAKQDFPLAGSDDAFFPGSELEVQIGYHTEAKTVFKGVIVKQCIRSVRNKHSTLVIEAKDKFVRLTIGRKNHCFTDKPDSEIIQNIVKNAGFGGGDINIDETTERHPEMIQYNVADWDFIVSRAEMNGRVVFTDANKLNVIEPQIKQDGATELTYGVDVIEMEGVTDARTQFTGISSHAWDLKREELVTSDATSVKFKGNSDNDGDRLAGALGVKQYHLYHGGLMEKSELTSWSNAQLLKSRMAKNTGRIRIKGVNSLKPGDTLKLKGFGKRLNGNVYVSGVSQRFDKSIWETEIHFGLSGDWFFQHDDVMARPASGVVPAVHGLHIARVMQLENDPMGEHRVKVRLPLVDLQEGIWARIACLDAGKERGSFFRPEIDDEVVVGFLDDDPRYPVILGMLNSSSKPAPLSAADANPQKGFFSRSKLKLLFDDEKKIINVETPKGKKIVLDDDGDKLVLQDQHNNKITLDSQGITMESGKDIRFKTSAGDVKVNANNIDQNATIKFSANGNSTAEFKSSGPTVLKGAIVNIN
jgi:Rhs element Vgr protein